MLIDVRQRASYGDLTSTCLRGALMLKYVDNLRDTMYDVDLGNESETDEVVRELNATPGIFTGADCTRYTARLVDLANRMRAKLGRVKTLVLPEPPSGVSLGLPLAAKVGLGLGALAVGGGLAWAVVRSR